MHGASKLRWRTLPHGVEAMKSMLALVRSRDGLRLERRDAPVLQGSDDVLVRVAFAGLCRTDMHVAEGRLAVALPRTLGHEVAGIVAQAPARARFARGDRVAIQPAIPCGECVVCRAEGIDADPPRCAKPSFLGVHRDGAFAELVAVPSHAVLPLPPSMSLQRGAYVEPVAAAMAVLRAPIARHERGLVYGDNRIAELTRRILVAHGFERIVVTKEDAPLDDSSFDFAVETIATTSALRALLAAVRPAGKIVLKSRPFAPVALDVAAAVGKEISFFAVRYGSFSAAIELLATDRIVVDDLFERAVPLASYERAFEHARGCESKKVFFDLDAKE
jgi:threonine dehydrogenase-like Zn-dependent dehydrogenase